MTLAIQALPRGSAIATLSKAPCGAGDQYKQPHTTGVVSRAQSTPCGRHWRPRRAETLTRRDYTAAARRKRSTTILGVQMKETKGGTDARFELRLEAALPA